MASWIGSRTVLCYTIMLLLRSDDGDSDNKGGEWGKWEACSTTCGLGQRSRVGCKKKLKKSKTCPPGQVRYETEECGALVCSSPSSRIRELSSLASSSMMSLAPIATASLEIPSPPSLVRGSRHLAPSSRYRLSTFQLTMTSSSVLTSPSSISTSSVNFVTSPDEVTPFLSARRSHVLPTKTLPDAEIPPFPGMSSYYMSKSPIVTSQIMTSSFTTSLSPNAKGKSSSTASVTSLTAALMPSTTTSSVMTSARSSKISLASTPDTGTFVKTPNNRLTSDRSFLREQHFSGVEGDWAMSHGEIKRVSSSDLITCALVCLGVKNCQSFNYLYSWKDSHHQHRNSPSCTLNSVNHFSHPKHLLQTNGTRYYYSVTVAS